MMGEDDIYDAFIFITDELSGIIETLKKEAANDILKSNFSHVSTVVSQINVIINFQERITQSQDKWVQIRNSLSDNLDMDVETENSLEVKPILSDNSNQNTSKILVLKTSETDNGGETYDLDYHFRGKSSRALDLFTEIRKKIHGLPSKCVEKFNKMYIAYSAPAKFCEVHIQVNQLKIWLNSPVEQLHDPRNLCRDVRHIGHYGTGATEISLRFTRDIEYVSDLIRQSYEQSKKYY